MVFPVDIYRFESRAIKKTDAGKDWRQEEKGMTENNMVGWHHLFSGYEFEQTPGDGKGEGSLLCCSQWGHKESDTTEQQQQIQEWVFILWEIWCTLLNRKDYEGRLDEGTKERQKHFPKSCFTFYIIRPKESSTYIFSFIGGNPIHLIIIKV